MPAVSIFIAMSTQWRASMAGFTGLDYNALPAVLRLRSVPRSEWAAVFEDIRVLEDAALTHMRKQ